MHSSSTDVHSTNIAVSLSLIEHVPSKRALAKPLNISKRKRRKKKGGEKTDSKRVL